MLWVHEGVRNPGQHAMRHLIRLLCCSRHALHSKARSLMCEAAEEALMGGCGHLLFSAVSGEEGRPLAPSSICATRSEAPTRDRALQLVLRSHQALQVQEQGLRAVRGRYRAWPLDQLQQGLPHKGPHGTSGLPEARGANLHSIRLCQIIAVYGVSHAIKSDSLQAVAGS